MEAPRNTSKDIGETSDSNIDRNIDPVPYVRRTPVTTAHDRAMPPSERVTLTPQDTIYIETLPSKGAPLDPQEMACVDMVTVGFCRSGLNRNPSDRASHSSDGVIRKTLGLVDLFAVVSMVQLDPP